MELSPKQQTTELIKKANRILILGHKNPQGDFLGSALALSKALEGLEKKVELVISDDVPQIFKFLPYLESVKESLKLNEGKIIRIDTEKYPVSGIKYQKEEKNLDIILDADKNLKFQFLNIINGVPKPDLIIILDTPDVDKIDSAYDANTELFFEVPIVNIDHHPGNEYFGTVNLVDLTASSTAEILVSLFEALGIKIADPDTATCLLLGLISDTQSFRSTSTTPKSLTVAAQLLAAGGRQQEIISNLYKKRPMALLKLWGEMLSGISQDKEHRFAWTHVKLSDVSEKGITASDVLDAADELLSNTPDADIILILCETKDKEVLGKLKGAKGQNVLPLAKLMGGDGTATNATFTIKEMSLEDAELSVLKKIHDEWAKNGEEIEKEVWDIMEQEEEKEEKEKKEDPIDKALESLEKEEEKGEGTLTPLKDVIEKKKKDIGAPKEEDIDVFEENE